MNNSSLLSDNINFNNQFVIKSNQTFISDSSLGDKTSKKVNSFEIKNYQEKINKNCVVKSATSKKWSIKFK
jgi:hypothetical protein